MTPLRGGKANQRRRRATLVAFCLVSSAVFAQTAAPTGIQQSHGQLTDRSVSNGHQPQEASEASNAYNEAMRTLHALHPPAKQATAFSAKLSTSFIRQLFPNAPGPVSTILRVANRVRNHRWIPRWLSGKMERIKDEDPSSTWNVFSTSGSSSVSAGAQKVIQLLEHAASLGHLDAMYSLAQLSLTPPSWSTLPINATRAFKHYSTHADITGNSTSQAHVAFFYATGYAPTGETPPVQVDQARALLYYTFAAHGGHSGASMVLGYRNWAGIGMNENCMAALDWYESAAEAAMAHFLSGPPGGRTLPKTATRISDLDGGAFGPGASVASTGFNAYRPVIKAAKARGTGETWDDLIEFYQFHADRDEVEYAYRLGKIYYQGSIYHAAGGIASGAEGFGSVTQDFARAKLYLLQVARHVWPAQPISSMSKNGHLTKKEGVDNNTLITATWAAAYLGRMYMRGEGVKQDFKVARIWFERGAEYNEKECLNALGVIWRDGLMEKQVDAKRAHEYFVAAAGQDFAEAQVNLGKYHYERSEYGFAIKYFEAAIRHGSPFEAFYYISSIHARRAQDPTSSPSLSAGSCGVAVSFFKLVAERGSWRNDLIGDAEHLWLGSDRNEFGPVGSLIAPSSTTGAEDREQEREGAKLRWWIAAEQGFEIAQNNLAYVLDQHKSMLTFPSSHPPSNQTARAALIQWTRSAAQHDVDALVKVGDYYYHGVGVDMGSQELRWEKAAGYYLSAVETQRSALAMWNLGWMYESGRGVNMDYHLAKRYYDMALDTNTEAYLPVILSLCQLYAKSLWYTLSGGRDHGLTLWGADEDEENHWYLGRVRDEFNKRWRGRKGTQTPPTDTAAPETPATIDSDDPVQWAEDQKAADVKRARQEEEEYERGDFFSGDFLAAGDPRRHDQNGHEVPDQDEFWETMFLVVLCIAISTLIFVRARITARAGEVARRHHEPAVGAGVGAGHTNGNGNTGTSGAHPPDTPIGDDQSAGLPDDQRGAANPDALPDVVGL